MKTFFTDAVCPVIGTAGEGSITGGVDIYSGESTTPATVPEVTYVSLPSAPAPGAKLPEDTLGDYISHGYKA